MKEIHLFYAPEIADKRELPQEESHHAVRVLRHTEGDNIFICDGNGNFYRAVIAVASPKKCTVNILETFEEQKWWKGEIALAVAPTKNMDRLEWLAEKATEVGIDAIHFVQCANSERRVLKEERIEKTIVAAMKQSRKATKPQIYPLTTFQQFLALPFKGQKLIAHCYTQEEIALGQTAVSDDLGLEWSDKKPSLDQIVTTDGATLVLIGPEGDFSIEEVRLAEQAGFLSISLGKSRLRTETAALMAVHTMLLAKQKQD